MSKQDQNQQTRPQAQLRKQYLKDCSFENPNAPQCFMENTEPKIDIALNLRCSDVAQDQCELNLFIEASAKTEEKSIFLASIQYCGVFKLPANIDQETRQEVMLIDAAAALFPYARHIIAKLTMDGGFPALDLGHMDFATLYKQKKQNDEITKLNKNGSKNSDEEASKANSA